MDQIAYSFCLSSPASVNYGNEAAAAELDESVTATLQSACDHAARIHQCQALLCTSNNFTMKRRTLDTQNDYNITLTGATPHVMTARGELLRGNMTKVRFLSCVTRMDGLGRHATYAYRRSLSMSKSSSQTTFARPFQVRLSVKASRSEILNSNNELEESLKPAIDKIVDDTKASLSVAINNTGRVTAGSHSESNAEIIINGSLDAAEAARVRVLVLLDEMVG